MRTLDETDKRARMVMASLKSFITATRRKTGKYLFQKKYRFNRLELNGLVVATLSIGMVIGGYAILSNVIPKLFALNDTAKVWQFVSSTAGDYTASMTVIDEEGVRPTGGVVGANHFENPSFSDGVDSWEIAAVPPEGWVEVPGNQDYSTANFLVMKYEAKAYDKYADSIIMDGGGTTMYANPDYPNGWGLKAQDQYAAISSPLAVPMRYVALDHPSRYDAQDFCQDVPLSGIPAPGAAHLMTNNEWMTIARNLEQVDGNWTGEQVGVGAVFIGNNYGLLDASDPKSGSFTRIFTLSNGEIVWDFAGNMMEWVDESILGQDKPDSGDASNAIQWPALSDFGSLSYNQLGPSNIVWDSSQGMGRYQMGGRSIGFSYGFARGGGYINNDTQGIYGLYLGLGGSNAGAYWVGFRCASSPLENTQSGASGSGRHNTIGNIVDAGSVADAKIFQNVNVNSTEQFTLSAYVYNNTAGAVGGVVDDTVSQLWFNGDVLDTTYEPVGDGWYRLSGSLTGIEGEAQYGVMVAKDKEVVVDDVTLARDGEYSVYTTVSYENSLVSSWDTFCEGVLDGSICTEDVEIGDTSGIVYQLCTDDGATCQSGNSWQFWDGDSWETAANTTTDVNSAAELTQTAMQSLVAINHELSVKAIFRFEGEDVPTLHNLSVGLTTDTTNPEVNASAIELKRDSSGTVIDSNAWTNNPNLYVSWQAGADEDGGSGIKGYCIYIGQDSNGDPATSKGLLGDSPVPTAGTTCQFIVATTSLDLSAASLKGSPWLTSSSSSYYVNIKAIDYSGNLYGGTAAQTTFRYDDTRPTNVSYISCAAGPFSNVADMNFSWPTSGGVAASDTNAGIMGWQYQINSTSGAWLGVEDESVLGLGSYIPTSQGSYTLTTEQDDSAIVTGTNVIYLRAVDAAGNVSSDGTIRTCNIAYGGAAPQFGNLDRVTVSPSNSGTNSFSLTWPAATPASGQDVAGYYYMVNTTPPATLATLQSNAATYVPVGLTRSVQTTALPNVNKGSNTVYVVAIDNADSPNYSPSNAISGSFSLNSTDPDNVSDLVATDSSIKAQSKWNVTLTWVAPEYQGAGNLTYVVWRSTNGNNFTQVGTTAGLSYVDSAPESRNYYYRVSVKDGANAESSGSNTVTITPTGRWTTAPALVGEMSVEDISPRQATITWSTDRVSDSRVQFGVQRGVYEQGTYAPVSSGLPTLVTSHAIQITGLNPDTTYFYQVSWTDEDGNTGASEERSFTTAKPPTVRDVGVRRVNLNQAVLQFTTAGAKGVKIYYGNSMTFGGVKEIATSQTEASYTAELTNLADGTKYYYKINTIDVDGSEYEGTVLDFTTLPRPRISEVRLQQVTNTAQSTIDVTWQSNTAISSVITYYPADDPDKKRDEVDIELIDGQHSMRLSALEPQQTYLLVVRGIDRLGNEAVSDSQQFTTATDTRPPAITDLKVEAAKSPNQPNQSQLIISWNTDEPATSQAEYGQGRDTNFASRSPEDSALTTNHVVVIPGLAPSQVYRLRAVSADSAGNIARSNDSVTITPKATSSALELVLENLSAVFGFLGDIKL